MYLNEELELREKTNRCRAADARLEKMTSNWTSSEITVSVILVTYSVYFIEGSQPLFVQVRCTASRVEMASLATPVNKSRSCSSAFEKIGSEK